MGTASFLKPHKLAILHEGNQQVINSEHFIIATGSKPSSLHGITIDKKRIISSTEALSLQEQPTSIVVIGGGAICVEIASIYARIGTRITILEYADSLNSTMDRELGKELKRVLNKLDVSILLRQRVLQAVNLGDRVRINFSGSGESNVIEADYALVAVGRKPYTQGLGLENTTVKLDDGGFIQVNEKPQTHAENIYAIGDVIGGAMLAHKAEEEGVFVAEVINRHKTHLHYHLIPGVVYTWPEVASVGYTEEQLKEKELPIGWVNSLLWRLAEPGPLWILKALLKS